MLIDWNPEHLYRKLIPDSERRRFFFEQVCTHEWNVQQDARPAAGGCHRTLISDRPDWNRRSRAFYDRWEEMLGGPITDTVELRELRDQGQHRLLALTNWSAETFPVALERYDFLHWFEGIVVSGAEKTRKPFPQIYQILLDRYAVDAQRACLLARSLANIQGAGAVGIGASIFKGLRPCALFWR